MTGLSIRVIRQPSASSATIRGFSSYMVGAEIRMRSGSVTGTVPLLAPGRTVPAGATAHSRLWPSPQRVAELAHPEVLPPGHLFLAPVVLEQLARELGQGRPAIAPLGDREIEGKIELLVDQADALERQPGELELRARQAEGEGGEPAIVGVIGGTPRAVSKTLPLTSILPHRPLSVRLMSRSSLPVTHGLPLSGG